MVAQTITTTVAEDGTIHLPNGAAQPGDTVVVRIELPATRRQPKTVEEPDLTSLTLDTAETSELQDAVIERWRAIGDMNRALLSAEERALDHGDWLYDENGLPQ